jgi:thiamine-phosphate pyrophosphorylase
MKTIHPFQYISQDLVHKSHQDQILTACSSGATWVQLRVKNKDYAEWLAIAKECREICNSFHAKLIINDSASIAKESMADGVHLGKSDMPIPEARKLLGPQCIIGGTANNKEELLKRAEEKVDYIGFGPYRFTKTKINLAEVLGIDRMKSLLPFANGIPVIAIGGIRQEDIKLIKNAGFSGFAVSSAVNLSNYPELAISEFNNAWD